MNKSQELVIFYTSMKIIKREWIQTLTEVVIEELEVDSIEKIKKSKREK